MPKHKVTVNVTANDIKYGKRSDGFSCPIHRALNRHKVVREQGEFYVNKYSVRHLRESAYLSWNWTLIFSAIPSRATSFITQFDCGFPVEPFTFEMEIEVPENAS